MHLKLAAVVLVAVLLCVSLNSPPKIEITRSTDSARYLKNQCDAGTPLHTKVEQEKIHDAYNWFLGYDYYSPQPPNASELTDMILCSCPDLTTLAKVVFWLSTKLAQKMAVKGGDVIILVVQNIGACLKVLAESLYCHSLVVCISLASAIVVWKLFKHCRDSRDLGHCVCCPDEEYYRHKSEQMKEC